MQKKLLTLALICALPLSSVDARIYRATTNNKNITCTLEPIHQDTVSDMFGSSYIGEYVLPIQQINQFNFDSQLCPKDAPIKHANLKYLAIKVKIKNKTNHTIFIEPDDYLQGIEEEVISKRDILRMYQAVIGEKKGWGYFGLATTAVLGFGAWKLWKVALRELQEDDELTEEEYSFFKWASFGLLGFLPGLLGIVSTHSLHAAYKLDEKRDGISKNSIGYKSSMIGRFKKVYPLATTIIAIKPGWTFEEVLFLDLKKAGRHILKKVTPELIYDQEEEIDEPGFESEKEGIEEKQ